MAESHRVFYTFPPTASDGAAKQKGRSSVVVVGSTSNIAIGNVEAPSEYMICMCTVPFHIRFGGAYTGGNPGAALAADMLFPANTLLRLDIPDDCTLFSIIREGGVDGAFYWYLPG